MDAGATDDIDGIIPGGDLTKTKHVASILQSATYNVNCSNNHYDGQEVIRQAIDLLQNIMCRCLIQTGNEQKAEAVARRYGDMMDKCSEPAPVDLLAKTAISSVESLEGLIQHVNRSRKRAKTSSGQAWKALDSLVNTSYETHFSTKIDATNAGNEESTQISHALASLALGLALSIESTNPSTAKMIASSVLPNWGGGGSGELVKVTYSMTFSALLGLLHLAADGAARQAYCNVDLQVVAKLESGFSIGEVGRVLTANNEENELAKAVGNVVDSVFGKYADDDMDFSTLSKDAVIPTLSLVANIRPWDYVEVENLVRCASELELWYSAELLCDAAISSTTNDDKKTMMATSLPKGAATEALMVDGPISSPNLPSDTLGHRAAAAIIDATFDYRLYRRADTFASKYYSFGRPERYAEARFLHACDTITKLVKKKQVQIIDKQIERVDSMVKRVCEDLAQKAEPRSFYGEDIPIDQMSEKIREFSLRRLRASNMHAAAARLAKLWGVEYREDPLQIKKELEERKLLYLQWNDEGCPGNSRDCNIPDLISEPTDLLGMFHQLANNKEKTVGFDCEWHDGISGVAVLQLSSITMTILLDIPALASTEEGCASLRDTVGKIFSQSTAVKHLIGFGCRDDIKRLRVSPCVGKTHWFPQDEKCTYKDLRVMIMEIAPPQLGKKNFMQHFGLSRACEVFLGKQLDKAEQCSDWLARPLSLEQREYASLDSFACAAIGVQILNMEQNGIAEKDLATLLKK